MKGNDAVLEIDWQGANQVREIFDNCCSIFILPPSKEELRRRLFKRGQDQENTIRKRVAAAQEEMTHYNEADFIIINDDFQKSCGRLKAILGKHSDCKPTNYADPLLDRLLIVVDITLPGTFIDFLTISEPPPIKLILTGVLDIIMLII